MADDVKRDHLTGDEIAIIGMAGRFPGAPDVETFWHNLLAGREGIARLDDEQLRGAGVDPAEMAHPRYVRAAPLLAGHDRFDASFFGYSPLEAEVMDPQQRILLEVAWQALEDAGWDPARHEAPIGVFAGSKTNTYLFHLASRPEVLRRHDALQLILGGDQALLATRVSFKLDLKGPSYAVQTACSTSLVAVHLACRSLLLDECRMALAGGVALNVPHEAGYRYDEGGILSPDGHCRPFDADAAGTVFGSGAGMVVLKRLADAEADGDTVRAVILGSATNNDGSGKATFTAPSVEGQTGVVLEALADARVAADSIGLVEAHGTGTRLGDPIEVLALTNAWRASTQRRSFCLLGSVKGNVGHLDAAAGMPALAKVVRALESGEVPPTLHYRRPNPAIDFAASPFTVAARRQRWERQEGRPRRAAVSSLGFGGTNAHLVLEEAPPPPAAEAPPRREQLLVLSGRTPEVVEAASLRLADWLEDHPELEPADVAWTLQVGRRAFDHRRAVVASDPGQAVEGLRSGGAGRVDGVRAEQPRAVFLFPGQGAQYPGMGRGLYATEAVFRQELDRAAEHLEGRLGLDLREVLFPVAGDEEAAAQRLRDTAVTQPALLAVELALGALWRSWGIEPRALVGHSVGEYAAAVLAGVLSAPDALELVAERGRLMATVPAGAMAAVALGEDEVAALLAEAAVEGCELAAANAPRRTVVAGPEPAVAAFEEWMGEAREDVGVRRLHTSHAFHSAMMDPVLEDFRRAVEAVELTPPRLPFVSNVTGTWITAEEATDPDYWVRQLRRPVRFADGLAAAVAGTGDGDGAAVLVEVGPGTVLSTFAREAGYLGGAEGEAAPVAAVAPSLRHPRDERSDGDLLLASLGRVWTAGLEPDWSAVHGGVRRRRVSLPPYPFDVSGRRHWIELHDDGPRSAAAPGAGGSDPTALAVQAGAGSQEAPVQVTLERVEDPARWLYRTAWEPAALPEAGPAVEGEAWLLFTRPASALGEGLARRLEEAGGRVVRVEAAAPETEGDAYQRLDDDRFRVAVDSRADHDRLLSTLAASGRLPRRVVHLWTAELDAAAGATAGGDAAAALEASAESVRVAFGSLLALAQALARREVAVDLRVVTRGAARVRPGDALLPEAALALGPVQVLPKEHPEIACRAVDLPLEGGTGAPAALLDDLVAELTANSPDPLVAWRDGERLAPRYEPLAEDEAPEGGAEDVAPLLRAGGVYLVTGGLGGVGSAIAGHLADRVGARLVLTGRSGLPSRDRWPELLAAEDGAEAEDGDAATVARIRRVLDLEERGAEVLVLAADATDHQAMEGVVAAARERFGTVHGVVHAAGVAGGGLLQLKSPEAARAVLDPKVRGARVLASLFDGGRDGDGSLDFLLLVSSLQSVMADFGQVDYAGANAFLDVFAEQRDAAGRRTVAIDFDNWREVGLLVEVGLPPHLEPWREELLGKALATDEALGILDRVLATRRSRVLVSTQELGPRIELSRRLTRNRILREMGGGGGGEGTARAAAVLAGSGRGELTRRVQAVWRRVLDLGDFDPAENFFDLGGDSLSGMQLISELNRELGVGLAPVDLYDTPSVAALVERLVPAAGAAAPDRDREEGQEDPSPAAAPGILAAPGTAGGFPEGAVAVIGLAGRFPGAADVDELWENLRRGHEAVRFFSDEELAAAGVPEALLRDPDYVKARPVLAGVDHFDAAFFGYSPRDARILDPQHRLFMEQCWKALEDAGYDPERFPGAVGVYAGSSISSYLRLLYGDPDFETSVGEFQALIGNEKDSLTTHVSYKLNLRGPSVAVQTFCSTSLVAVHTARRALLAGECDMALAGGVSIHLPQEAGYRYDPSGGVSRDGHLRAFDAAASGYVFGNGVGAVVLKRLDRAVADGDTVRAVILGSAVNNDGSLKAGFTATAVDGQAGVAARCLEESGVDPASIGYVECHGSATPLGDPVEVAALNRAFGRAGGRGTIPVGSVKTNVGHLDRAAGVTGLIKAVLTLERGEVAPSLHFRDPNPNVDFDAGPFYVNTELAPFPRPGGGRRRAAVNSLGLGGTNAHVVLEEAPPVAEPSDHRPVQVLTVSARTATALETACGNLAAALEGRDPAALADAAWTLQVGRRAFEHRRAVVCRDAAEAVAALGEAGEARRRHAFDAVATDPVRPPVVFLFSGLGSQYAGMGAGLYLAEEVFRREVDRCAELLHPHLEGDVRERMWPGGAEAAARGRTGGGLDLKAMLGRGKADAEAAPSPLDRTLWAQPALFALEYAMARLWRAWGMEPDALLGYSLGEYVAAAVSGVLRLEDAAALVARRARLIDGLPPGAMLGVPLTPADLEPHLGDRLSLAAVNGPEQSVVAGPVEAVEALRERLEGAGTSCRRLATTHAFHSSMMEPIRDEIGELVAGFDLQPPRVPYLSNVTGTWITAEQATDAGYWGDHACRPVLFAPAVAELGRDPDRVLLELGPGQTLGSLALQCADSGEALRVVGSLPGNFERRRDDEHLATAVARLWLLGCGPDWERYHASEVRRRIPLPTYPFEGRRFWVDGPAAAGAPIPTPGDAAVAGAAVGGQPSGGSAVPRLHVPAWKSGGTLPDGTASLAAEPRSWLVLAPARGEAGGDTVAGGGTVDELARRLAELGHAVHRVEPGDGFADLGDGRFRVAPGAAEDWAALLAALGETPRRVIHGWALGTVPGDGVERVLEWGYRSLRTLAATLAPAAGEGEAGISLWVLARGVYDVTGDEALWPAAATLLGPCQTLSLEYPGLACRVVELGGAPPVERLLAEIAAAGREQVVAYRGRRRWLPVLDAGEVGRAEAPPAPEGGWLVLGATGDEGRRFAGYLVDAGRTRLVLATGPEEGGEGGEEALAAAVAELESRGAQIATVDVTAGAAAAVAAVRRRFGSVAGVVVAPGTAGAPVQDGDGDLGTASLARMATTLEALDEALEGEATEGRFLVSSLAGGGGDLAASFARNLLFDAHAHAATDGGVPPWVSVSWDLWQDGTGTGEAGGNARAAFGRLLGTPPAAQVLVSARPLERSWNRLPDLAPADAGGDPGERHPRPHLAVEYVEPRNDVERTIAGVWEDLLGLERVGVHDSFLELGGDSLLASRLATRLRTALDLDLPVRVFFEAATVEELGRVVAQARSEAEATEMEELYARLATLSDEEVLAELEKRENRATPAHSEE